MCQHVQTEKGILVFLLRVMGMRPHQGLLYKAQMEEMPQCYTAIFNVALAVSPFTLCLYLIMLCEFWIFPPALKWNVNY